MIQTSVVARRCRAARETTILNVVIEGVHPLLIGPGDARSVCLSADDPGFTGELS